MRPTFRKLPVVGLVAGALLAGAVAVIAVGAGVAGPACAPAVPVGTVAAPGVALDAGQLANARIIYAVGAGLGLPMRAEIVAIATAMQESRLWNLPYGSADSLGLFQQRPSQGWGTPAQIMNPVAAARMFYQRLVQVGGWQQLSVAEAAQAVQHSALPAAYANWQSLAARLVASFAGQASTCLAPATNVPLTAAIDALPRRYALPATTPLAVAVAIRFALAQLGTAYQLGGSCTDPHSPDMALHCDCSSLVQQAYAAAGMALPRTTFAQVGVGTPVYALTALRPGDLLFTAGADGTPVNPGHVGMYIGDGLVVQAPQAGQDVQLNPLAAWAPQIVAMRRIV